MLAPQSHVIHTRFTIDAGVQLAAAAVLLKGGVEGGEQLGQRATRSPDPPAAAATAGSSGRGSWRS
jgi:hypothetical protein